MTGRWRLGFDPKERVEDGIRRADEAGMDFVEFNADIGSNGLAAFDPARIGAVRAAAEPELNSWW